MLFAITVHEVAHGWMAKRLGDATAQRLGRLTLNPFKHIDPIGTVLVPLLLLLAGGGAFGWAKPIPVTAENLRHPKRDMVYVAAAGPFANLLMAAFWGLAAVLGTSIPEGFGSAGAALVYMGVKGVEINAVLMMLNLLPLPPLDGGRIAVGLLPGRLSWQLSQVEPYGFFVLLALFVTENSFHILGTILGPPIAFVQHTIFSLVSLLQ